MRLRASALAATLIVAGEAAAQCASPGAGYARLEAHGTTAWLATQPASVEVGREFAVEAALCIGDGAAPRAVRIDAWMPAHRHGMNSTPSMKSSGPGRWRAEGFVFHMPGRWQFTLEIDTAAGRTRLTRDVDVE